MLFVVLRREKLVRATGGSTQIECYHDKIREVVLEALGPERSRAHHRALADALLDSGPSDPEHVAVHLLGGEAFAQAAEQFALAAERAGRELGFDRAARLYEQALQHGLFGPELLRKLRVARADSLAHSGHGIEAADAYALAYAGAPEHEAIELRLRAAEQCLYSGDLTRGLELQTTALAALGVRVPKGTTAAVASVVYHETRLRL